MKISSKKIPSSVAEYIATFPKDIQKTLSLLRKTIKDAAPKAEEVISYQMPAYKQNGMLVFFAAYEKHIGFYPTASGIVKFKKEIEKYKWSKGAVQFPIDKNLPISLVSKIVKFKVKENQDKFLLKTKKQ